MRVHDSPARTPGAVMATSLVVGLAAPAYAGPTWVEALAWLIASPPDRLVIDALVARIDDDGLFAEPVRLEWREPYDPDEDEPGEADVVGAGVEETGWWVVGNGMHRIAAAATAGLPWLWVTTTDAPERAEAELVEVSFTLPEGLCDEDALHDMCEWLRSIPLPHGAWAEALGTGQRGGVFEQTWLVPHVAREALFAQMAARVPGLAIGRWRELTMAVWDAELAADEATYAQS